MRGTRSLQAWADHFLDEIGYFTELRRSEKNPEDGGEPHPQPQGPDRHLDASTPCRRARWPTDLQAFLEEITLDTEREEEEEEAPATP